MSLQPFLIFRACTHTKRYCDQGKAGDLYSRSQGLNTRKSSLLLLDFSLSARLDCASDCISSLKISTSCVFISCKSAATVELRVSQHGKENQD